jgi:hypothetical protein
MLRVARPIRAGGASPILWGIKHPLDSDYWWVDATLFCNDLGDTIGQAGRSIVAGDGALTIPSVAISSDGMKAGFKLCQGTSGVSYVVRTHLTFLETAERVTFDLLLQVISPYPVPVPDPTIVTNNQDVVLLGGVPFPSGAPS